jgi:hypothetical protein
VGGKANCHRVASLSVFARNACLPPLAVRGTALRARAHFALPIAAAARARRALHFDPRVQQCPTRRAARGPVSNKVRVLLGPSPPCPLDRRAPTASTDGEHRRHIRRYQQRGEGWGARQGAWRGGRRRAGFTSLSATSYSASLPIRSASCFGVSLHARGCCGFGSAVRRSAALPADVGLDGPSVPLMSSSAMTSDAPLPAAAEWSGVTLPGRRRRGLGRCTHAARRKRNRRTRGSSGRSRRRRMRRAIGRFGDCRSAPPSAARLSQGCARRGRREGVGPTGPNRYPKTKQHA